MPKRILNSNFEINPENGPQERDSGFDSLVFLEDGPLKQHSQFVTMGIERERERERELLVDHPSVKFDN